MSLAPALTTAGAPVAGQLSHIQTAVMLGVLAAFMRGQTYRAKTQGERVTLASLYRAGFLDRRPWRGRAGSPDAAYEYSPSEDARAELERVRDRLFTIIAVCRGAIPAPEGGA